MGRLLYGRNLRTTCILPSLGKMQFEGLAFFSLSKAKYINLEQNKEATPKFGLGFLPFPLEKMTVQAIFSPQKGSEQ